MPFKHMRGPEAWEASAVWPRSCYDSKLDPVTEQARRKKDEDYQLLAETSSIMGWRTLHDCYLLMDLALADVMEAFRSAFFRRFKLDALQYVTLPGAAFDAMLLSCTRRRRPLSLITDMKIYRAVRDSVMGGLSCIFQPCAKASHPGLDDFNPQQEQSYILPLDVNSMYPGIMTLPLPCDSGAWVTLPESQEDRLVWLQELLRGVDFRAEDESECHLAEAYDRSDACSRAQDPQRDQVPMLPVAGSLDAAVLRRTRSPEEV